ncbi:TetR/AcrR family transcriptional regulator [Nocardia sp. CDC159]|uniref:TetR/AcrR family transcriptional regulator n=1 Tax=Nocardia pulmonis TaxID=2951408 RepID=A0A9X2IXD9_9NOCA|nr:MULTISPECIES: TetR/AcrR family transcriptional regulator [Nocardia]MCM6775268.1 TetR/AcrR family transcriptional regulator [Nocardia pulmonis]MCM6787998.1 TetR/AcrR family transcriptional regulator [Nocardia sp. CDC159]
MPKIVDPTERRKAVADAVFRVVAREGVENASLRRVAEEAGLVVGSVRHYFGSHAELLSFTLAELNRRVTDRVLGHLAELFAEGMVAPEVPGSYAERILVELLPLDEARFEESAVWLAFTTAARSRPELAELAAQPVAGARSLVHRVLSAMSEAGVLRRIVVDLELETDRLAALLDGLALAAVVDPARRDPNAMRAVLRLHLASLVGPRPEADAG